MFQMHESKSRSGLQKAGVKINSSWGKQLCLFSLFGPGILQLWFVHSRGIPLLLLKMHSPETPFFFLFYFCGSLWVLREVSGFLRFIFVAPVLSGFANWLPKGAHSEELRVQNKGI